MTGASIPAFGLAETADAKKKRKKKVTLCFNRQTVKKPKQTAKKLQKKGATTGACDCGNGGPCFMLVTAATFTGSGLQGLTGADSACQEATNAAGLPRTSKAWLSANGATPTMRFTNTANAGPYVCVLALANGSGPGVGSIVANSFAEMLASAGGIFPASSISDTEGTVRSGNSGLDWHEERRRRGRGDVPGLDEVSPVWPRWEPAPGRPDVDRRRHEPVQ